MFGLRTGYGPVGHVAKSRAGARPPAPVHAGKPPLFAVSRVWTIFAGAVSVPPSPNRRCAASGRGQMVGVAQSVRAPDCGSGGRRFESGRPPWQRSPLTPAGNLRTIVVYQSSPSRCRATLREANPDTGPGVSIRFQGVEAPARSLDPRRFFDNRGHEKRAGPSPVSTCVLPVFVPSGRLARRTKGFNNADSEQRIRRIQCSDELSSNLSWRV